MGNLQASAYAEAVADGMVPLEIALTAHLTSNFYPPLPTAYVEPILAAITAVDADEPDTRIEIDPEINPQPRMVGADGRISAGDLVEITHTEAFLAVT